MAFFKFRWPGQADPDGKPAKRPRSPQGESIEVMRRRARHRLMGAAVLVLLGVVGFPLLFDTQPRPIPVDVPIEIPDRGKVPPLVVPAKEGESEAPKSSSVAHSDPAPNRAGAERLAAGATLADGEELISSTTAGRSSPKGTASAATPTGSKADNKTANAAGSKPPRVEESVRGKPPAETRSPAAAASPAERSDEDRFIVQVGAFADAEKAKEVRIKLERAGLKTYTQVVDAKDGKRTRVRLGPYSSRAEADKAAARIKGLDLPASILTL
jgi:DedD protein